MARRTRRIYPDVLIPTPLGGIPAVSREAQERAVLEANVAADLNGGCLSILYERTETGIENERLTTGMLVNWQDRTDAKPQPEEHLQLPGELPDEGDEHAEASTADDDHEADVAEQQPVEA